MLKPPCLSLRVALGGQWGIDGAGVGVWERGEVRRDNPRYVCALNMRAGYEWGDNPRRWEGPGVRIEWTMDCFIYYMYNEPMLLGSVPCLDS